MSLGLHLLCGDFFWPLRHAPGNCVEDLRLSEEKGVSDARTGLDSGSLTDAERGMQRGFLSPRRVS
jgi:hypothetical protein